MVKRWWPFAIQTLMALALPVLLATANIRLVTSHRLLSWEYNRPGFPPDPYGLTTEERIQLAGVCVDYLVSGADISLLADLRLADGTPAFNARELQHMADVQAMYQGLMVAARIAGAVILGGALALGLGAREVQRIPAALLRGSLLSLGLWGAVGGIILLSWETFFVGFHDLFFEAGTWQFPYSDTLIRLYPVRFWVDVVAAVMGLAAVEVVVIGVAAWVWGRGHHPVVQPPGAPPLGLGRVGRS